MVNRQSKDFLPHTGNVYNKGSRQRVRCFFGCQFNWVPSVSTTSKKIWQSGEFPASWRNAIVVPIPKPNSQDSGPAAFRTISLTSCTAKLFECIINRRLITELESGGRLGERLHAFLAGRGTDIDEHCSTFRTLKSKR